MGKKWHWVVLGLIFGLGLVLRLVNISRVPPGFTSDEAAFGYNAYSLIETGRDEWGTPFWQLPLTNLKSFGDYKLPLYAFLAVPTIKILDLNVFATRFPAAIFGSLGVIVIYLLVRVLNDQMLNDKWSNVVALTTATMLAISPWHVGLSRGAFEANLVTLLVPLSFLLLLKNKWLLTAIFLTLAFYSYHSAKFIVPFFLGLSWWAWPEKRSMLIKLTLILILFTVPGLFGQFGPAGARSSDVGIFHPDTWAPVADRRFELVVSGVPDIAARVISNKVVFVIQQFTGNLASYFSPQFLFTTGAGEGTYGLLPGQPLLYWPQLIGLGFFCFWCTSTKSKPGWFLLAILLLSAVPAALAKGPGFAANRAAGMIGWLAIISVSGWWIFLTFIKNRTKLIVNLLAVFIIAWQSFSILTTYFRLAPGQIGSSMLSGRLELLTAVSRIADRYSQIRISRQLSEPHIYAAFVMRISPQQYQQSTVNWPAVGTPSLRFLDQFDGYFLQNFRFGNLDYSASSANTLYLGKSTEFPSGTNPLYVYPSREAPDQWWLVESPAKLYAQVN